MARDVNIEALYAAHRDTVLRFFVRRTADPETALDLWAETFAQAVASRKRCRASSEQGQAAWLWSIAHRQLDRYLRRGYAEQRMVRKLRMERPPTTPSLLSVIERETDLAAVKTQVAHALNTLPPATRAAIELRVMQEQPYPDIAIRLGISEVAARARVSRGLQALATTLDPDVRTEVPTT